MKKISAKSKFLLVIFIILLMVNFVHQAVVSAISYKPRYIVVHPNETAIVMCMHNQRPVQAEILPDGRVLYQCGQ